MTKEDEPLMLTPNGYIAISRKESTLSCNRNLSSSVTTSELALKSSCQLSQMKALNLCC